ncbi:MAG: hypothetical protein QOJ15_12089 [Bradyrhizobium sp.]|jgi:hypothetical protein|nr:hypothetical protein [Bradyrhizobium sp.]
MTGWPRFLTILTGRNLPKIRQSKEPEPSIINERTIADFHARGRADRHLETRGLRVDG